MKKSFWLISLPRETATKSRYPSTSPTNGGVGGSEYSVLERPFFGKGGKIIWPRLYGDWSRKNQMKGCSLSPTSVFRKLLHKRFHVIAVDEYHTSKKLAICAWESSAGTERRTSSYSNAAANILQTGTSNCRPLALRRRKRDLSSDSLSKPKRNCLSIERDFLTVSPARASSNKSQANCYL